MTTLAGERQSDVADEDQAPRSSPPGLTPRAISIAVAIVIAGWGALALWASIDTSNDLGHDTISGTFSNVGRIFSELPPSKTPLITTSVFVVIAALMGAAVLRLLRLRVPLLDEIAMGACVGMVPMTVLILVVGSTVGLAARVLAASMGIAALLSIAVLWRTRTPRPDGARRLPRPKVPRPADIGLGVLAALLLLLPFLSSLSPEVNWDARWYHLGPPRHFVDHGTFYNIIKATGIEVTGLPSYQEALYTGLFGLRGAIAAKLLSLFQLVIVMLLLVAIGRRHLHRTRAGLFAAIGFAAIPVVTWSAATAYADIPIALATTGAMYAALSYRSTRRAQWLLVAGLLCGWAYGVKLFGLFTLVGIALVVLWPTRWRRDAIRESIRPGAIIGVGVFIGAIPGVIRTAIYTGDPVFPFLTSIFPSPYWNANKTQVTQESLRRSSVVELPIRLVRLPYDLIFDAGPLNSLVGPIFLALLPAVVVAAILLRRRRVPNLGWLAAVSLVWTVLWMLSGVNDSRYLLAVWPLALLALAGLALSVEWSRARLAAGALATVFVVSTALGSQFLAPVLVDANPSQTAGVSPVFWDYLYGNEHEHEVVLRWLPLIEQVNAAVPADGKVYDAVSLLYINYLYVQPEVLAGSTADGPLSLREWSLCNADAPWRLRAAGVTHVVLDKDQTAALRSSALAPYLEMVSPGPEGNVFRFASERIGPEPANVDHTFCVGIQGDPLAK